MNPSTPPAAGGSRPSVSPADSSEVVQIPKVLLGFFVSICSALSWGVGNAVTRWSADKYPAAAFDIIVLKYLLAGAALLVVGGMLMARGRQRLHRPDFKVGNKWFLWSVVFKSLDAYLFVVAVTMIPATTVATFENLHVVWTAILLVAAFGANIPRSWLTSSVIIVIGASLITGIAEDSFRAENVFGLSIAVSTGLFFALFNIAWVSVAIERIRFDIRTLNMGLFLVLTGVLTFPLHVMYSLAAGEALTLPFTALPMKHLVVQSINGLLGIGATYFLMNEAISLMRGAGRAASLLLGLGISSAVLFTLLTEMIWFEQSVSTMQWIGLVLFSVGFASVRSDLLRRG